MNKWYQHVLSPIKIGNHVLKTRLIFSQAVNHTIQGTEDFLADPLITFYSEMARNGTGLVTVTMDAVHFYGGKTRHARVPAGGYQ